MSSAVFPKRRETPGNRALPIIAFFESDALAAKYFIGVQRFRRLLFNKLSADHAEAEKIVVVSNEDLVEQHYNQLRVPNTRVLALTNSRFKDPRNDGVVYAYLPMTFLNRCWNAWPITRWTIFILFTRAMKLTRSSPAPAVKSMN